MKELTSRMQRRKSSRKENNRTKDPTKNAFAFSCQFSSHSLTNSLFIFLRSKHARKHMTPEGQIATHTPSFFCAPHSIRPTQPLKYERGRSFAKRRGVLWIKPSIFPHSLLDCHWIVPGHFPWPTPPFNSPFQYFGPASQVGNGHSRPDLDGIHSLVS